MRKNIVCLALLVLVILLSNCQESGTLNEFYIYPKALWGEWVRMDNGNTWYIASNYIEVGGNSLSNSDSYKFNKQSNNVIQVTSDSSVFYLYASRIPNSSFKATILKEDDSRSAAKKNGRAVAVPKGMRAKVPNVKNPVQVSVAETQEDGLLEVDNIIAGDSYDIEIGNDIARITPNVDGEDIGNIIIIPEGSLNFTTSIHPTSNSTDMMALRTGTNYSFNIRVTNTGTVTSSLTSYQITPPGGLTVTGTLTGMLGTVQAGAFYNIQVTVNCSEISDEYEFKKIGINLKDNSGSNLEWNDTVSLKFNKNTVNFNIKAMGRMGGSGSVNAIVIVPGGKAYSLKVTGSSTSQNAQPIKVPKYAGKDYLIVFSGATVATESAFSFSIDSEPTTMPADFVPSLDPNIGGAFYTQNSTEGTAQTISPDDKILSFLGLNNIIYFKVKFHE